MTSLRLFSALLPRSAHLHTRNDAPVGPQPMYNCGQHSLSWYDGAGGEDPYREISA